MKFKVCAVVLLSLSGCGAVGGVATGVFGGISSGLSGVSSGLSGSSGPFSGGGGGGSGGLRGNVDEIDGVRFRTRVRADAGEGRAFTTETRGASRNLEAAIVAGQTRAVEYCLRRFGGTDIIWVAGPDRPIEEIALSDGGAVVLSGTCITR